MVATLNSGNLPTSVSISSVTDVCGMVENVGVAVGIESQAQSVQLLFPFPVSVAAIFIVGSWPTSGNVRQCRTMSTISYRPTSRARPKIGGRSWNRGAISLRSKVISTSGLAAAILNFGKYPTSGNVGRVRDVFGMVSNIGVAVGIVSPPHCVQ